jgi:hypothetical protein
MLAAVAVIGLFGAFVKKNGTLFQPWASEEDGGISGRLLRSRESVTAGGVLSGGFCLERRLPRNDAA